MKLRAADKKHYKTLASDECMRFPLKKVETTRCVPPISLCGFPLFTHSCSRVLSSEKFFVLLQADLAYYPLPDLKFESKPVMEVITAK